MRDWFAVSGTPGTYTGWPMRCVAKSGKFALRSSLSESKNKILAGRFPGWQLFAYCRYLPQSISIHFNPNPMRCDGPLLLIEDDADDQDLILCVLKDLGVMNNIKLFSNGEDAFNYLLQTTDVPFLILSDINMPVMDGISLKKKIDSNSETQRKCIPFVFLSTSPEPLRKQICELNVQGYFRKGNSLRELNETLMVIVKYWNLTQHLS